MLCQTTKSEKAINDSNAELLSEKKDVTSNLSISLINITQVKNGLEELTDWNISL